jgi:hypothetical protein
MNWPTSIMNSPNPAPRRFLKPPTSPRPDPLYTIARQASENAR